MKKERIQESEIIELFQQLPRIQDQRDSTEIYQQILKKINTNKTKRKRKAFISFPAIAFASVLFLSVLIASSFFQSNSVQDQTGSYRNGVEEIGIKLSDTLNHKESAKENQQEKMSEIESTNKMIKTALYSTDLQPDELFVTLAIPDEQVQNIIPITFVVKKSEGKNWLDLYNEIAGKVQESSLELGEFYPYQGELTLENNDEIRFTINEDHSYDLSSTSETLLMKSFESFRYQNIKKVNLYSKDQKGVYLPHSGELEQFEIPQFPKVGYFIYQTKNHIYLAPSPKSYENINDALSDMTNQIETHNLKPSIIDNLTVSAQENHNGQLTVYFPEKTILKNNENTIRMIEAILLTAKDFGFDKVLFRNIVTDLIGDFYLKEPINVPIAPNKIEYIH